MLRLDLPQPVRFNCRSTELFPGSTVRLVFCLAITLTIATPSWASDNPPPPGHPAAGESTAGDSATADPSLPAADSEAFYNQVIQPLLAQACYDCHSHDSGESAGLLFVDSGAAMAIGGTRGAAIVAGDPAASPLYQALLYDNAELQMPPDRKLSDDEISHIRQWIAAGAVAPPTDHDPVGNTAAEASAAGHWGYHPPQATYPHEQRGQAIDRLLEQQLQAAGLAFSPPADRRTLLRRVTYDLTGLSPSFDQLEAFAHDLRPSELVYAEAVDRLLQSPQFGERWARYWMDVARYSDTKGYTFQEDREYPEAYRYRDWLIRAFNDDLPYDQFVRKQLAADLQPSTTAEANDDLPALGFLTLGRRFLNNERDIIDDRLDVVTRGLMGMTVACARCHDHKYDPISAADYYALSGVFLNTHEPGGEPFAHRLEDRDQPRESRVLLRGNPAMPADVVPRRFVSYFAPDETEFGPGSGRNDLVDHIVDSKNPLTARVMANRIWMHLMGSSLVQSPSDLGTRCPPPHQQALLDQMAVDFQTDGWSIKRAIRRVLMSQAYQQQSLASGAAAQAATAIDPNNELYWRMNRRRRDVESMRDALLLASGQLDQQLYGPSLPMDQPPFPTRRTLYAYIDRQELAGFLRNFDMASPEAHSSGRTLTSVPQQGLYFLNSDFVALQATELGIQAAEQAENSDRARAAQWLFRQILGRQPERPELALMMQFLAQPVDEVATDVVWIAGYGTIDPEAAVIKRFEPFPAYQANRWGGSGGVPDDQLGWCHLTPTGGHPGAGNDFATIRRWIAPQDGKISIRGLFKHPASEGDGVRATIVAAGEHNWGQWTAHHSEQATTVDGMVVKKGQTVDFVTDSLGNQNHDSFSWSVQIRYWGEQRLSFDAQQQFPTPLPEPLDSWQMLAQALLASNELAFID